MQYIVFASMLVLGGMGIYFFTRIFEGETKRNPSDEYEIIEG